MAEPDFWADKNHAQEVISEYQALKDELEGVGKYDKGDAIITIFSGAGGDDSEDFSRILYDMYLKYADRASFTTKLLHQNQNNHGGYRNVTFEISGSRAYGILKHESGVHRLVRLSPFNAKSQRHTSFSMVEVIPKLPKVTEADVPMDEVEIDYSKSSGPGGQNVNKRETAVRIVHNPTGVSVSCDSERSQERNKEKALEILAGKLFKLREEARQKEQEGMYISKSTQIEWGNQIRSYVFHPYQMVKDHRTDVEVRDIDKVLDGEIDEFLEAEKDLS